MVIILYIFSLLILLHLCSTADILCNVPLECANQTTTASGPTVIFANGYRSNSGSLSSITSGKGDLICAGAFSCSEAISLHGGGDVRCRGSNSCSKVSHISTDSTSIFRMGANALSFSFISRAASSTEVYVHCSGEQSCIHSYINASGTVLGSGAYSLLYAVIDSVESTGALNITLTGYYAAYGAIIRCRTGHICNIHCSSNACASLITECDQNCPITAMSPDTIISTRSSNVTNNTLDFEFYDSWNVTRNNDKICSLQNNTVLRADTYRQYYSNPPIAFPTDSGPLCCRGMMSCNWIDITYTSRIVCSGSQSCGASTMSTNEDVFCEGYMSCTQARITAPTQVYCMGFHACGSATIATSSHLYCTGEEACFYTTIKGGSAMDRYIYLSGYKSGHQAMITCELLQTCFVYCLGTESCLDTELTCDGACHVTCDVDSYCPIGWEYSILNGSSSANNTSTASPSINPSTSTFPSRSPSNYMYNHSNTDQLTIAPSTKLVHITSIPSVSPSLSQKQSAEISERITTTSAYKPDPEDGSNPNNMGIVWIIIIVVLSILLLSGIVSCGVYRHTIREQIQYMIEILYNNDIDNNDVNDEDKEDAGRKESASIEEDHWMEEGAHDAENIVPMQRDNGEKDDCNEKKIWNDDIQSVNMLYSTDNIDAVNVETISDIHIEKTERREGSQIDVKAETMMGFEANGTSMTRNDIKEEQKDSEIQKPNNTTLMGSVTKNNNYNDNTNGNKTVVTLLGFTNCEQ